MSLARISHRLVSGKPLVLDSDAGAAFRARGVTLDTPGALGLLLRQRPLDVLRHHQAEAQSLVDVTCALTADTTPRALAEVGMQHRAAMLTGLAVELAQEAAAKAMRPVAVAGVLGSDMVGPIAADRLHEEMKEHAARVAMAGVDLMVARGQGSRLGLMAAVVAAAGTDLPTWAVIECGKHGDVGADDPLAPLARALQEAGASAILFEVPSVGAGVSQLQKLTDPPEGCVLGVLLASSAESVRGFPDQAANPVAWADHALELDACGARIIGGGAGTTEAHTAALAQALGALHPSLPATRSDTEIDRRPPTD